MPRRDINNAQTPVTQTDIFIYEKPRVIRSAMKQNIAHLNQQRFINTPPRTICKGYSVYSAHKSKRLERKRLACKRAIAR
jgi:hypothetical protein